MIVFFDTNVLVSAVATRGLCADLVNATLAEHQLIVGETVLTELRQVLRQKLRIPVAAVNEMEAVLRLHAKVIKAAPALRIRIRDESDRMILAEAIAGQADVLVTGDLDLLEIAKQAPVRILSPRRFWDLLRNP